MNTMRSTAGLNDLRTRLITLSLLVGILAMQFPISLLAGPTENRCVSSAASETCARDSQDQNEIETCCGHTSGYSVACAERADEDSPASESCCPEDCEHCALPCCGGPLASFLSEVVASHAAIISTVFLTEGTLLSTNSTKIFHPPRV